MPQALHRALTSKFPAPEKAFSFYLAVFYTFYRVRTRPYIFHRANAALSRRDGIQLIVRRLFPPCLKKQLFSFSILSLIVTSFCFSLFAFFDRVFPIHRDSVTDSRSKSVSAMGGFISRESNFRPCFFNEKPGGFKPPGCRKRPVKFKAFD